MRLTFETILAPAYGSSNLQAAAQAFLDALIITSTELNYLGGATGNIQSRVGALANLAGCAFTGNVTLFGTPSLALHAATKGYVDGLAITGKLPVTGGTMTGALALSGDATEAMQVTTKGQMDADLATAVANTSLVTDLTTGFPRWNTAVNEQVGTGWATFQSKLQALIAEVRKAPLASYAKMTPTGVYTGSSGFRGCVLMSDGRVFIVPHNSTAPRIYDPVTDTLSTPGGSYPGGVSAYTGAVLLKDGRVFCVPSYATAARIYDPAIDTTSTPTGVYPGGGAFWGGVLLKDGRVFCVPYNSTTARIYDPATDTLTTPNGTYPGTNSYGYGVLLPDGRVFMVPRGQTVAKIYDPVANTVVNAGGTFTISTGGVLLPDGRVFCVPINNLVSSTASIYNPTTNTVTQTAGTFGSIASNFESGVLLPDGRVFCVPIYGPSARIYDPLTDTITTPAGNYDLGATFNFCGGVLLPDGRVFCAPHNATAAALAQGSTMNLSGNKKLPMSLVLSPFFNKG